MPDFSQPRIDTHHHIFDPQKFPYISDTPYRPEGHELGTVDYYRYVMDAYNIRHSVIIGPTSAYNTDNSYLLDTLKQGAGRFKGIAVVPPDSSTDYLAELKQAGVAGIAMNVAMLGTGRFAQFDSMLARLHELDLIADIQVTKDQLPDLMPMLLRSKTRLLFDHSGRPDVAAGLEQPGFRALLSLAETDRCWVKLSGLSQFCEPPFPYTEGHRYQLALLAAFGADRCMWGSDWPFLRARQRMDIGTLLVLADQLLGDAATLDKIMWQTPKTLFGFGELPAV